MTKAEQRKRAVKLTLPVFCGYIVLGIAFGATLAQAGYGPVWALAISTLVYAGSLPIRDGAVSGGQHVADRPSR